MKTMRLLTFSVLAAMMIPAYPASNGDRDSDKRLAASAEVMTEIMGTRDRSIPQDLLNNAACAIVVPGLKKGAFILGGKYGRGFVSCRKPGGVGWSAPGGIRVEGGSFGFQIGGAETDVVMLVMNQGGMSKLLTSRFTLGADASVAAGPVGRESSAQTDAFMNAEILTWSRQRGVFAGVALTGATLRDDTDTNLELYGQAFKNREIVHGNVVVPASANQFLGELNKYSSRK
jgi:lipid-binding SYLF domain-containing protein